MLSIEVVADANSPLTLFLQRAKAHEPSVKAKTNPLTNAYRSLGLCNP